MKLKNLWLVSSLIFVGHFSTLWAEDEAAPGCRERALAYCDGIPNIGENCSIGTCSASLAQDGDCTVEAVFNADQTLIDSCRVCATVAVDAGGCAALGGNFHSPS